MSCRGFSLIETIIAAALTGILVLGITTALDLNLDSAGLVAGQKQRNIIKAAVSSNIMYPDVCAAAFGVNPGPPAVGTKFLNLANAATAAGDGGLSLEIADLAPGSAQLAAGEILSGRKIQIENVEVYNLSPPIVDPAISAAIGVGHELRRGTLRLVMSSRNAKAQKLALKPAPLGIIYFILQVGTGRIDGCYSPANRTLKEVCEALGGVYKSMGIPPCRFQAKNITPCPNGQLWHGLLSDGTHLCRPIGSCPAGTYMTGINGTPNLGVNPPETVIGPPNMITCHDPEWVN